MVKLDVYWKHGLSKHPLYHMWNGMLQRCENPRDANYPNYGARGIAVCDRWHDLRLFIEDIDRLLGQRPPRHSLDRYPDNDGNYEPGNVRWASPSEQTRNSRKCLQTDLLFWDGAVHQDDSSEALWRPVPGYEGWYEASCCGRVYSLPRPGTAGGLLRPQLNSAGYEVVRLSRYGRVRTLTVRSIIRKTFPGSENGRARLLASSGKAAACASAPSGVRGRWAPTASRPGDERPDRAKGPYFGCGSFANLRQPVPVRPAAAQWLPRSSRCRRHPVRPMTRIPRPAALTGTGG